MSKIPARYSILVWILRIVTLSGLWARRPRRRPPPPPSQAHPSPAQEPISGRAPAEPASQSPGPFVDATPDRPSPARSQGSSRRTGKVLTLVGIFLLLAVAGDLVLRGFKQEVEPPVWQPTPAEADPGRRAIVKHGCGGCHVIPGIRHATGRVGPQLNGFRDQTYIGGVLPNLPQNLAAWIQNPQRFSPQTAMPNLQVTPEEALSIAAYLYANP